MRRLASLIDALERHTGAAQRQAALTEYLRDSDTASAGWMIALALERGPQRRVTAQTLREWASEATGHPDWMISACYEVVGDVCETLALLVDHGRASVSDAPLGAWMESRILPALALDDDALKAKVIRWWSTMEAGEALILNRILTGTLKVHAPLRALVLALAAHTKLEAAWIEHRLSGSWPAGAALFEALAEEQGAAAPRPYPLPAPDVTQITPPLTGLIATSWPDGQRAELVRRGGAVELWADGGARLTERFPDLVARAASLPDDTALDGMIVAWADGAASGVERLHRRLATTRTDKAPSRKLVAEAPCAYIAHDLMERSGATMLDQPLSARWAALGALLEDTHAAQLAARIDAIDAEVAEAIASASDAHLRGVLLRSATAPQRAALLVEPAPRVCIAVLMYVRGRGAGAEHSFGVWDGPLLVRIASIKGGMSQREAHLIEHWARTHTMQRFGPVREVSPEHVYELRYRGTLPSNRHRAGFELRDAHIARKRDDIVAARADTIDTLNG